MCGIAEPIRSFDHGGEHFHSVRRERQVTVIIDPAMRIRNNIQNDVDCRLQVFLRAQLTATAPAQEPARES